MMTMTITNHITVSAFEKKKSSCSHLVFVFFFPSRLYHTVITKKEDTTTAITLASCKKTHTLATPREAKRSKQDNAYKNIEKSLTRPSGLFSGGVGEGSLSPASSSLTASANKASLQEHFLCDFCLFGCGGH